MRKFIALAPQAFIFLSLLAPAQNRFQACLPSDVKADEVISVQTVAPGSGGEVVKKQEAKKDTVKQKLIEMKARCRNGKLLDRSGKEIRFYRLAGCWGNPPADYQEILASQRAEIEELRKRYTVVEIECLPSRLIQ
jgi:hypothetical protein